MKKKFWTGRLKTILIVALIIAICAAVTLAITNGTSAIENVVGTILSPIRAGVADILLHGKDLLFHLRVLRLKRLSFVSHETST